MAQKETRFSAPIVQGVAPDGTATEARGRVPALRRLSVSANGAYTLPGLVGGNISRLFVNVETTFVASTSSDGSTIRIGRSTDETYYGSIKVSAVGFYPVAAVSGAALLAITEGSTLYVDVTAATSASTPATGQASLYVEVYPLENS